MKPVALVLLVSLGIVIHSIRADEIDNIVRNEMERRKVPGIALGIVHKGKEIRREYGFANLEHQVPVKPETVFEIGNVNTQFTAAAILLLAEEGRLSLDDQITRYLTNAPNAWNKITIRHLLHGSSGIKNYSMQPGFELSKRLSQSQIIEMISATPLEFEPGEKTSNGTAGFVLLGYVVENITGENFWVFAAKRIFSPLGMNASGDREPRLIISNRASGYVRSRSGNGWINRDPDISDLGAAGSMVTTVGDLLKWDAALNTGKILKTSSRDMMWTRGKLNDGKFHNNGFGCRIDTLGLYIHLHHSGATGGFAASYSRLPEPGLTIVVLANGGDNATGSVISKSIATALLRDN
jgi:D-alanyl-D-alanine carboxypeptidase